jgi:hypothetical protein
MLRTGVSLVFNRSIEIYVKLSLETYAVYAFFVTQSANDCQREAGERSCLISSYLRVYRESEARWRFAQKQRSH